MTYYKFCRRCGRRLKGEENRLRGFGEICFQKAKIESSGITPLLTPTYAQAKREIDRLKAEEQALRARAEEASKARARAEARANHPKAKGQGKGQNLQVEKSSRQKTRGGETPHLENTLSPTYKKPLLFTPHTRPHPTDR